MNAYPALMPTEAAAQIVEGAAVAASDIIEVEHFRAMTVVENGLEVAYRRERRT